MSGRPNNKTGANDPTEVTHGFTINNPAWAWLILNGHKIIENRDFKLQPGWYAVHVGATADCSINEELSYVKDPHILMPPLLGVEKGVVYGLCKIGTSVPYEQCKKNQWSSHHYAVCNIITDVIPFTKTMKVSGNLNNQVWPITRESTPLIHQAVKENLYKKKATGALRSLGLSVYCANETIQVVQASKQATKTNRVDDYSPDRPGKTMKTSVEPKPLPIKSTGDIRNFFCK